MRVLIGCESSGTVRDAFSRLGHDSMSCDLRPSATPGDHYVGDLFDLLGEPFDLVILHPPCTYLSRAGIGIANIPGRPQLTTDAAKFFRRCLAWPAPSVAVENPVMMRTALRQVGQQATQFVEPFHHGDPWTKKTGLWLRGLELLRATDMVHPEFSWTERVRGYGRSVTSAGLARAMSDQWSQSQSVQASLW